MGKAAEKSAVRWSCVVLAALFFFCGACALTLRGMQRSYGCAADDTAGRDAMISGMFDDCVSELAQYLQPYFETEGTMEIETPQQFEPENTNLRLCATDAAGNVILTTLEKLDKADVMYSETKTTTIKIYGATGGRLMRNETLTVDCYLTASLEANDVFRRTLSLMQIGAAQEKTFWIAGISFLVLTAVFCLLTLRSVLREAKRPKGGASRMFNALPPDLYACCVLPALILFGKFYLDKSRELEMLRSYLHTGGGEYRLLMRPACLTGMFALLLIFVMLLIYSFRCGGIRSVFSLSRFCRRPFPRRMLFYLVVMQFVKGLAIALYLTAYTKWVVLFLLLEKVVTLPVVFRMLRQLRDLMDKTSQFVQGDLSGAASRRGDYATVCAHGADVDSIVRRISDSADEYVRSSRFKAELITNLSHDIKTPLTSIISYAQLLDRDDLTQDERKTYLEVLQRHTDRLNKLVEDLTEVSDAASGNVPVQTTVLDLCSLVYASALGFDERLQKRNITIQFRLPDDPVFVTADPRLLQRVADNLMNNICKYALAGSAVQIAVVDGKTSVAAVFRNRSAQPLTLSGDALMERFVREDGSRHTDGSGLGLSIAQSLMSIQGGKLWLHTEGDVFTAQILFRKS